MEHDPLDGGTPVPKYISSSTNNDVLTTIFSIEGIASTFLDYLDPLDMMELSTLSESIDESIKKLGGCEAPLIKELKETLGRPNGPRSVYVATNRNEDVYTTETGAWYTALALTGLAKQLRLKLLPIMIGKAYWRKAMETHEMKPIYDEAAVDSVEMVGEGPHRDWVGIDIAQEIYADMYIGYDLVDHTYDDKNMVLLSMLDGWIEKGILLVICPDEVEQYWGAESASRDLLRRIVRSPSGRSRAIVLGNYGEALDDTALEDNPIIDFLGLGYSHDTICSKSKTKYGIVTHVRDRLISWGYKHEILPRGHKSRADKRDIGRAERLIHGIIMSSLVKYAPEWWG